MPVLQGVIPDSILVGDKVATDGGSDTSKRSGETGIDKYLLVHERHKRHLGSRGNAKEVP